MPREGVQVRARARIPQTDFLILASHRRISPPLSDATVWPSGLNATLLNARVRIPQTDGMIPTPRCEGAAIRTERNAEHPIRMPREGAQVRARSCIPQTDG
jgi:hypothetical protein